MKHTIIITHLRRDSQDWMELDIDLTEGELTPNQKAEEIADTAIEAWSSMGTCYIPDEGDFIRVFLSASQRQVSEWHCPASAEFIVLRMKDGEHYAYPITRNWD